MRPETITVLLVDDDEAFRDLSKRQLEQVDSGLSVVTESSAAAGLETLAAESIDCIVSDYEMPEMDGLEFLEAVREEHPTLPFVLHTGKGSEEIAAKAINAGVDAYYQKAADTGQYAVIAQHVTTLVDKHRAEQRLDYLAREQHIADGGIHAPENAAAAGDDGAVSLAVVEAVAAREGVDPVALTPPLHDAIDPDTLDTLFARQADDSTQGIESLRFEFCGYTVTVSGDGDVTLEE